MLAIQEHQYTIFKVINGNINYYQLIKTQIIFLKKKEY